MSGIKGGCGASGASTGKCGSVGAGNVGGCGSVGSGNVGGCGSVGGGISANLSKVSEPIVPVQPCQNVNVVQAGTDSVEPCQLGGSIGGGYIGQEAHGHYHGHGHGHGGQTGGGQVNQGSGVKK
ncbi:uncharacterized protein O3C94_017496 [Discoglossus pictus]